MIRIQRFPPWAIKVFQTPSEHHSFSGIFPVVYAGLRVEIKTTHNCSYGGGNNG